MPEKIEETVEKSLGHHVTITSPTTDLPAVGNNDNTTAITKNQLSSIVVHGSSNTSTNNQELRKGSSNSVSESIARGTTLLCFRMSDVAVSILILLPLTIALWRGLWQLMQYYTDPWFSIFLGNLIEFCLHIFQEPLKSSVNPRKMNFVLFYVISRALLLTHAFASINQWRGLWDVLDHRTSPEYQSESAMLSLVIGSTILILAKLFCNVLATPLIVGVDEATSVHEYVLRYKTPPGGSNLKYISDCFLSAVVVQNLVVAAWRGLWNLANIHLYPSDKTLSAFVSLTIGITIFLVLSILQPCYFQFMIQLKGIKRLIVFDVVTMWGFIACVLAWRGNWDLYDIYIVFDTPMASEWLTVGIGIMGSVLLGCLSTLTSRGITIDGEDSGDGTTEWPISYVTLLQKKRHHGIPFPEPWVFRYLCTSQRMRMTEPLTLRRRSADVHVVEDFQKSHQLRLNEDIAASKLIKNSNLYVQHLEISHSPDVKGGIEVGSSSEEDVKVLSTNPKFVSDPSSGCTLKKMEYTGTIPGPLTSGSSLPTTVSSPPISTIVSVEFEVFGSVQGMITGCYFTKYCKEICEKLSVGGWVKNSKSGTILGKIQGTRNGIDQVVHWLAKTGSPGCKIDRLELSNWEFLTKQEFRSFSVRF